MHNPWIFTFSWTLPIYMIFSWLFSIFMYPSNKNYHENHHGDTMKINLTNENFKFMGCALFLLIFHGICVVVVSVFPDSLISWLYGLSGWKWRTSLFRFLWVSCTLIRPLSHHKVQPRVKEVSEMPPFSLLGYITTPAVQLWIFLHVRTLQSYSALLLHKSWFTKIFSCSVICFLQFLLQLYYVIAIVLGFIWGLAINNI